MEEYIFTPAYLKIRQEIANLTGFEAENIDMDIAKKINVYEANKLDYFEFSYKNKYYILKRGELTEINKDD